jgi:hypothetical protein
MALDFDKRNYDEIKVPTPIFQLNRDANTVDGFQFGGYRKIDAVSGLPSQDIAAFATGNYLDYGTPNGYDLNKIPDGYIQATWEGNDVNFLNYKPIIVLYGKKRTNTSTTTLIGDPPIPVRVKKRAVFKFVRITHLNGSTARFTNYRGNPSQFALRKAEFPIIYDNTDFLKNARVLTTLDIDPLHYIKSYPPSLPGDYGYNIFPISYEHFHGRGLAAPSPVFGKRTFPQSFFRRPGRYPMANHKMVFKVAIEIEHPLDKTKRLSSALSTNTLIIEPHAGYFTDIGNTSPNPEQKFYYAWNVRTR